MKMKSIKIFSIIAMMTIFAGCNNDDDDAFVSTDDAAEMVAASLSENSSGLTVVVSESADGSNIAVENSGGRVAACGYSLSEEFTRTSPTGSEITYNYNFGYDYVLTCDQDAPLSIAVNITFDGEFDGTRLATSHSGTGDFNYTALDEAMTSFVLNGTYSQSGTFQSKVGNKNSGSSSIVITLDQINVDKSNQQIVSGSASVLITGNVTGKAAFNYTATVTFTGNKTGTLTINDSTYAINLLTGEVTKQ